MAEATEKKLLWVLSGEACRLKGFPYKETPTQYRYTDGGRNHVLRKEDFVSRNGIYRDRQTYYGFDKEAVLKQSIAEDKAEVASIEEAIARKEALLQQFQEK